jgi:putative nucleotidyltransferase with HDIG domain
MRKCDSTAANEYLKKITDLPPAPGVAAQLLGLFKDPDIDIDRVVHLIRQDPSLTANVIKMCNRASFRGEEPSSDLFEAVTRLGFYEVYRVVAALLGARAMSMWKTDGGLDINDIWRHSVASAVAAGKLAGRSGESEAIAYTTGLLHDIGKLALASVEGARYARLVREVQISGTSLAEAEREAFGVDHALIGEQLLCRWGLPPNLAKAVGLHNSIPGSDEPLERLTAIVQIASDVAHQTDLEDSLAQASLTCHPEALKVLGITEEDVSAIIAETRKDLHQVAGLSMASSGTVATV